MANNKLPSCAVYLHQKPGDKEADLRDVSISEEASNQGSLDEPAGIEFVATLDCSGVFPSTDSLLIGSA